MKSSTHRLSAIALITAFCVMMSSCSVDRDELSDGLDDLRDAISDNDGDETTASEEAVVTEPEETLPSDTEETSVPEEPEATATPVPTATSTPTPTPIPEPERVDFSEFTEIEISDILTVVSEEFGESYVTEDGVTAATFTGERIAVTTGTDNVTAAINLLLDGFYSEAEGLYNRYTAQGLSELSIGGGSIIEQDEEEPDDNDEDDREEESDNTTGIYETYNVTVDYAYSDNGRVLSVIMDYKVSRGDETIISNTEYASFDILTGQYVTIASVASDYDALCEALEKALARTADEDTADDETEDEETEATECEVTFIACQTPGAQTATAEIYGTINGSPAHTTVDMNLYSEYLNRYGKTVYGVQ